jgi:hypothetical protein
MTTISSIGDFYKQPAAMRDVCAQHTHSGILVAGAGA